MRTVLVMARMTEPEWKAERARLFLRELNGQRIAAGPDPQVTADMVGDAIGLDALEVSVTMAWLIGRRLITEVGLAEHGIADPYTVHPIEITDRGMRFLETGE